MTQSNNSGLEIYSFPLHPDYDPKELADKKLKKQERCRELLARFMEIQMAKNIREQK